MVTKPHPEVTSKTEISHHLGMIKFKVMDTSLLDIHPNYPTAMGHRQWYYVYRAYPVPQLMQ